MVSATRRAAHVRRVEIVIDSLWHSNDVHAFVPEISRDMLRSVSSDDDDRVDAEAPRIIHAER